MTQDNPAPRRTAAEIKAFLDAYFTKEQPVSEWNDHQNEPALQPTDENLTVTTGQRLTVDPGTPTHTESEDGDDQ